MRLVNEPAGISGHGSGNGTPGSAPPIPAVGFVGFGGTD